MLNRCRFLGSIDALQCRLWVESGH